MDKAEFARVKRDVGGRAELYEAVGHDQSLKGISLQEHAYSFYQGQSYKPPRIVWAVEQQAKATAFSNWPRELATADTKEGAIKAFIDKMGTTDLETKAKGTTSFSIYRERGKPGYIIGKKIGREMVALRTVANLDDARQAIENDKAGLEAQLEKYKATPLERRPDNQPRVGDDHRNGAPVTPKVFGDTFGFRGVQFGNYVEQARRQSDLNEAYDALMDLAAVLEVPPRALSLDGRLGLAFGARGKGGKGAPGAHYESGTVVINLTKGGGPGSLAHEWWHAADNYFANQFGATGSYMTDGAKAGKLRPEMVDAFERVMKATTQKGLRERSDELDGRRSKPYWNTRIELSARAFESYVIAKLQDHGAANDYLANVVSQEAWDGSEAERARALERGQNPSYPYPSADEMPAVREAFDHFFQTVETKTDEAGNVGMFSRRTASGNQVPDAVVSLRLADLNNHPEYQMAKAGDVHAALMVAEDLVKPDLVDKVKAMADGKPATLVPVASVESTGRNKIPLALAEVLADRTGLEAERDIVQANSPKRTSMDGLDRLLAPPVFDGEVQPGGRYILVDDAITQGGTFAALASHIHDNGGQVVGVVALTGKQYSAKIAPSPELLGQIREKYADVEPQFRAATGYGFDALTESEARYIA
jgi:hypothetical protein